MIVFESVYKRFGALPVLNGIDLNLEGGACIALLGPNGCGKTTLIKTFLGMVLPDSGSIKFKGHSIHKRVAYRHQVGYMPQIGRYPEHMRVGQLVDMVMDIRSYSGRIDMELFDAYRIDKIRDKRLHALSGGTTQKVSATLAFLFHPEVLILDEPTAGLDPIASSILRNKIVAETRQGRLILITSHLLSELDDMVNRIIFMQEGQVQLNNSVSEIFEQTGETRISKAIYQILSTTNG